jgi:hypothetical protein
VSPPIEARHFPHNPRAFPLNRERISLPELAVETAVAHTVTYFVAGLLSMWWFDYERLFVETDLRFFMRPLSDPMVSAGPLLQPIRGALYGAVFYLLRDAWLGKRRDWLILWVVLVALGVIGPFGPIPGSFEGLIYTKLPLWTQLVGLPEVVLQALALAVIVCYWINHPEKKWLKWCLGIAFFLVILMGALGLLVGQRHQARQ